MHVRIAWEIYHHQNKQQLESKSKVNPIPKPDLFMPKGLFFPNRPPTNPVVASSALPLHTMYRHNLPPIYSLPSTSQASNSYLTSQASHIGKSKKLLIMFCTPIVMLFFFQGSLLTSNMRQRCLLTQIYLRLRDFLTPEICRHLKHETLGKRNWFFYYCIFYHTSRNLAIY